MKRVVIVGGGFAGTQCARVLQSDFSVTLVDAKDYFEYTPGILRTIVEPDHADKIQVKHSKYLKKAKIVKGKVDKISRKEVFVNKKKIPFDYLIIGSGSAYRSPIKDRAVVLSHRADTLKEFHDKLHKANSALIIGGGMVGVELAAEICTHYKDKEIMLVHSRKRLMNRNSRDISKHAEKFLKKNGVKIIFGERVSSKKGNTFTTESGNEIKADIAFFCTGIKPNSGLMKNSFPKNLDERAGIKVNKYLQLEGFKNIFVGGDVTAVKEEKLAQNAEEQAKVIISNIRAMEAKEELESYKSNPRVMVLSLGKYDGILIYKGFSMGGFVPAFLKWGIERWTMAKYK